jgi:hypothetical protein
MKKSKVLFVVMLLSGINCTNFLHAQSEESKLVLPKIGLGIHGEQYRITDALDDNYLFAYTTSILMPINLTQHFRIEPEVGLLWLSSSDNDPDTDDDVNLGVTGGLGIFGMWQRDRLNFYAGGRFTLNQGKVEGAYTYNGESGTLKTFGVEFGPVAGFEYFLGKNFSLGGEMGLGYKYSKSNQEIPFPDTDDEETTTSKITFNTGIFVRAYF